MSRNGGWRRVNGMKYGNMSIDLSGHFAQSYHLSSGVKRTQIQGMEKEEKKVREIKS